MSSTSSSTSISNTDCKDYIQKIKEIKQLNEKLEIIRNNKHEIYRQYKSNINKLNKEIIPKIQKSFETYIEYEDVKGEMYERFDETFDEIDLNEINELKNENKINKEKMDSMNLKIGELEEKLGFLKKDMDKHYVIITNELNEYLEKKGISPCIICQSVVYVPVIPISECHHNGSCRFKICITCMRDGILNVKRHYQSVNYSELSLKYKCPICKEVNDKRELKYIINFPYMEVMDHYIKKFTEKYYKGLDLVLCDKCEYTTSSVLELWKHKKRGSCIVKKVKKTNQISLNQLPYNDILQTGQYSFSLRPEPPEVQPSGDYPSVYPPTSFVDLTGNIHFGDS